MPRTTTTIIASISVKPRIDLRLRVTGLNCVAAMIVYRY
jgi:hypothetical protein